MSYNIGQFRRTQKPPQSYMEYFVQDVDYQLNSSYPTKIDSYTFNDLALEFINSSELNALHSYFLRFSLYDPDRPPLKGQKVTIKLKNANSETVQTIETVVKNGSGGRLSFDILITPIATFKHIVFELERVADDYKEKNSNGMYGRKINITIDSFGIIKNILTDFLNLKTPLTKISVQGPKGLKMCINGESIRIGKSGFYEIDNGMKINYFGVILESDKGSLDQYQYFILDYQFEVKGE